MLAFRTVVSVLLRALGDVSLHPQGRPCGRQTHSRRAASAATNPNWIAHASTSRRLRLSWSGQEATRTACRVTVHAADPTPPPDVQGNPEGVKRASLSVMSAAVWSALTVR
jgi:hypothetical protein